MVWATYTMVLPLVAFGPSVGPLHAALTSVAFPTAALAAARASGQLAAAAWLGDAVVEEPLEQPATTVAAAASSAAARTVCFRVVYKVTPLSGGCSYRGVFAISSSTETTGIAPV
jgi:hypothetical protein